MECGMVQQKTGSSMHPWKRSSFGYTVVELLVTMLVGSILTAMALPMIGSATASFNRTSAVTSVTGAIQSARYSAIYQGVPYRVVFTKSTSKYQLQSDPARTGTYSAVGSAVPLQGTIGADTTLELHPSGLVKMIVPATGSIGLTLTYSGVCENISVTTYGNVSVILC
jgi:Tfp pilus assembly protein FimT